MYHVRYLSENQYHRTLSAYQQSMRGRKNVYSDAQKTSSATYHVTLNAPLLKQSKLKDFGRKAVLTESEEADLQNNLFRNAKANIINLDSLVPNYHEESCFQGTIGGQEDVDYYKINTVFQWFAHRPVYITMDAPRESGCKMTLYDLDGNQVGFSEENEDGTQTLKVPCDWSDSKAYTLKIEGGSQNQVIPYKLTFRQGEVDAEFQAVLNRRKNTSKTAKKADATAEENTETFLDINKIRKEKNAEKIKELHKKQYEALPKEKRYSGEETLGELLARKKNGETLSEKEEIYLRIYGNLADVADVENALCVKTLANRLKEKLSEAGLHFSEGMRIMISSDGGVKVGGGTEEENALAEKIIQKENMAGELRNAYFSVSETVKNMTDEKYRIAMYTDELNRILYKASEGKVTVDDIQITEKKQGGATEFYLAGLPSSLDKLINNAKEDSVYEDYYKKLFRVLEYRAEKQEKPEFCVELELGADGIKAG